MMRHRIRRKSPYVSRQVQFFFDIGPIQGAADTTVNDGLVMGASDLIGEAADQMAKEVSIVGIEYTTKIRFNETGAETAQGVGDYVGFTEIFFQDRLTPSDIPAAGTSSIFLGADQLSSGSTIPLHDYPSRVLNRRIGWLPWTLQTDPAVSRTFGSLMSIHDPLWNLPQRIRRRVRLTMGDGLFLRYEIEGNDAASARTFTVFLQAIVTYRVR